MKAVTYLDEDVVIKRGIQALVSELGSMEAVRFMTLPREKRIDSVRRHQEWQDTLNKDAFFNEVFVQ